MKYTIVFHTSANLEFKKAIKRYEEEQEGLGERFRVEIERKIGQIADSPFLYPEILPDFRQGVAQKFPYVVV
jgi:hypothetical protein